MRAAQEGWDDFEGCLVAQAAKRPVRDELRRAHAEPQPQAQQAMVMPWPDPRDRNLAVERGVLKLMLQVPTFFDSSWNGITLDDFSHPAYRAIFDAISSLQFDANGWPAAVQGATDDETVKQLEVALLVEPLLREPDERYVTEYAARLQLLSTMATIRDLKSSLQRMNPLEDRAAYDRLFSQLLALEKRRKELQAITFGND